MKKENAYMYYVKSQRMSSTLEDEFHFILDINH